MSRIVKCGLIQTSLAADVSESLETIRNAQIERTLGYIDQAGREGVQMLCMQEIFTGPYFCAEQNTRWYDSVEKIPDGPTTKLMQEYAKRYSMVIVVPIYEEEATGVYYNTAAVIDADGSYLGKYRKNHIPHVAPGFWEKFYFRPGNLGYPVFDTALGKVGVNICYDRHFPEGARALGLNGAEIVLIPSATTRGLSEYLWRIEQVSQASECDRNLSLDAACREHPPGRLTRVCDGRMPDRALADSRLTTHDDRARSPARRLERALQHRQFGLPANDLRPRAARHAWESP
jgi:N-carbamoylputrescine amidase